MAVFFDLLGAQNRDHGERGIARLVSQLALAIERRDPSAIDSFIVHPHLPIAESLEPLIATGKVVRLDAIEPRPSAGGVFIAGSVVELEEPMSSVLPWWARGPAWTSLAILYDLIPLRFPDQYLADAELRARYNDRVAAYGLFDRLLPISIATRDDATELLNIPADRQRVIYAGVDDRFRPPVAGETLPAIEGLRPGYVLFPTGIDWRKNIDRTLEAYALLPERVRAKHQLVLATRLDPWVEQALREQAEQLGIGSGQLLLPGYLPDETLVGLNQFAEVAIFPSIYEGFGLPVLEAMQCGTAVICSDTSSLLEVQTNESARFDPLDVDSISAVLERALTDADFVASIRDHANPTFSWDRSAQLTLDALAEHPDRSGRSRVAIVSPLPPQPSGISAYTERLAPELASHVEVTLYSSVNDEEGAVEFDLPGCQIRPLSQLERDHRGGQPFDAVVYMMGNSRFHLGALEMLRRIPGAVIFHDARFTGLMNEAVRLRPELLEQGRVGPELQRLYPDRYRPTVQQADTVDAETAQRFGILGAVEIATHATRCYSHSSYAADLLHIDTGGSIEHLFDLPCPEVGPTDEAPRAHDVVAAFGIVDPAKEPALLIEAVGQLNTTAKLRFVGECEPVLQRELEQAAQRHAVHVEFTGTLGSADFAAEQANATIAVQLRRTSNGESSGAVAELLANGTPTVVTGVGASRELPQSCCLKVPPDISASELSSTLTELLHDTDRRKRLSDEARRIATTRSYAAAARRLVESLGLTET